MAVPKNPSVALVYDKVGVAHGGAEQVLLALHAAFPEAPLFTSIATPEAARWSSTFTIHTSWLQRLGWLPQAYRLLVPLFPLAFENFDLSRFNIIITITSGEAKGCLTKPNQLHVCYVLTPPRYLYSHTDEYQQHPAISRWPMAWLVKQVLRYLHWWDVVAATRPDVLIPISSLVAKRIRTEYSREPTPVLYPPTPATSKPSKLNLPVPYLLSVSRLVPYKHVDLSIQACQAKGRTLIVVGTGIEQQRLIQLAGNDARVRAPKQSLARFLASIPPESGTIIFTGAVQSSELSALYSNAQALLMPGIEDYGITALEAAQHGTPTLMHQTSGAAEVLPAPKLSIAVPNLTVNAMIEAIEQLSMQHIRSGDLQKIAKDHTFSYFQQEFKNRINTLWHSHCLGKESECHT